MQYGTPILLVEDDPIVTTQIRKAFAQSAQVDTASSVAEARKKTEKNTYDVFLLDRHLPDGLGTSLISEIRAQHPASAILVMTSDPHESSVREALHAGATDYVIKSSQIASELQTRIFIAKQRLALERRCQQAERSANESASVAMIGNQDTLAYIKEFVSAYGPSEVNILITGETGTGKELIARSLNQFSYDRSRPFVALNCGAIAANLVESELFGHIRGAFTGAITDRVGKIEEANNGDLFLDEIGELSLEIQAKLLRVIETGQFSRTGENRIRTSHFRIIAATHRNLKDMVQKGTFREDLYYRLACGQIGTIPLRDRKQDLSELIKYFAKQHFKHEPSIDSTLIETAMNYRWPGNIRELRNAVSRAAVLAKARGDLNLRAEDLGVSGAEGFKKNAIIPAADAALQHSLQPLGASEFKNAIKALERDLINRAIRENNGNLMKAGNAIGVHLSTLYRKLAEHEKVDDRRNIHHDRINRVTTPRSAPEDYYRC